MIDLKALIQSNRTGQATGLPCFCTANEHVLRAILDYAARTDLPVVIEATCNQVNQDGGYTGMTPGAFMEWLADLSRNAGVSSDRLIPGGDHLGPNPWRHQPAEVALGKAGELVRLYVEAGFRKIHLDASMQLGGEPPLSVRQIAERAAALCTIAEQHAPDPDTVVYIIGTEVPVPGGETDDMGMDSMDVTSVARLTETIDAHREAFAARGLDAAWSRIVAVVTQPGVDFSNSSVYPFDPSSVLPLAQAILTEPGVCFEAHSTDYQPGASLSQLVENHFFFLKVGPELTFRFREAVFALADMETHIAPADPSRLKQVISRRMDENDLYWRAYYHGSAEEIARYRSFSYSDRIRYYWSDPAVSSALTLLMQNLQGGVLSASLVSQYFGRHEFGEIPTDPLTLVSDHVQRCVNRYFTAAGLISS